VAERLKTSFYVDNCVTSVDSEEELQDFVRYATQVMAKAIFELRGWKHTALGAGGGGGEDGWRTGDNSGARFVVGYARGHVIL
jgi:hypothetical protein